MPKPPKAAQSFSFCSSEQLSLCQAESQQAATFGITVTGTGHRTKERPPALKTAPSCLSLLDEISMFIQKREYQNTSFWLHIVCVTLLLGWYVGWSGNSGKLPPGRLQARVSAGFFIFSDATWVLLVGLGLTVQCLVSQKLTQLRRFKLPCSSVPCCRRRRPKPTRRRSRERRKGGQRKI